MNLYTWKLDLYGTATKPVPDAPAGKCKRLLQGMVIFFVLQILKSHPTTIMISLEAYKPHSERTIGKKSYEMKLQQRSVKFKFIKRDIYSRLLT